MNKSRKDIIDNHVSEKCKLFFTWGMEHWIEGESIDDLYDRFNNYYFMEYVPSKQEKNLLA